MTGIGMACGVGVNASVRCPKPGISAGADGAGGGGAAGITWSGIVVRKLGGGRESASRARRAPAVRAPVP
jgi:hypothetical protein